jgi:putative transposase
MHRLDALYTEHPYYGVPRMTAQLRRDGYTVNHKRIERLMRLMGLAALFPKKKTSRPGLGHVVYPYLLRSLLIDRPNQVWGTDITYIRARGQWFYLVAMLDWFSRYVLAWQLSPTMASDFCQTVLTEALTSATPAIHNSDQGSQFTSAAYTNILKEYDIRISMDGRGRCFDNIFTERLWRTVKYEEVYLHDYQTFAEAESSLTRYFQTYNHRRLHQALGYQTPAEVYFGQPHIVLSHPAPLSSTYPLTV